MAPEIKFNPRILTPGRNLKEGGEQFVQNLKTKPVQTVLNTFMPGSGHLYKAAKDGAALVYGFGATVVTGNNLHRDSALNQLSPTRAAGQTPVMGHHIP